jgi:hypothetical protein
LPSCGGAGKGPSPFRDEPDGGARIAAGDASKVLEASATAGGKASVAE